MYLTCEECDGAVLITFNAARFDAAICREVRDELRRALRKDQDVYLFDLSHVEFIDSSGVGTLVGFSKYAGRTRRIELCGLTPAVTKIFRLTNLLGLFTIHQDAADGLLAHRVLRRAVSE